MAAIPAARFYRCPPREGPPFARAARLRMLPPAGSRDPAQAPSGDPAADLRLVAAARLGNAEAQEQLAAALAVVPAMLRAKNQKLGALVDSHTVEDAAQNALLAVWRKLELYDGRTPVVFWAYGFAVIELRRAVERRGRRREEPHVAEVVDHGRATPVESELGALLDQLEELDRRILHHKHTESMTFPEIGERLTMPTNTAKTRYYRAIAWLRQRLGGNQTQEHRA